MRTKQRQLYQRLFPHWDTQTTHEEIANSLIHGVGIILSIAALVILISLASERGDVQRIISFSIYGISLILLYLASTLHHSLGTPRAKRFFEICDYISIFLLIAGTYTPIALIAIGGPWGWTLLGLIWTLAILGMIITVFPIGRLPGVKLTLYIGMGWFAIIVLKPLLNLAPYGLTLGLLVGGIVYTLGVCILLQRTLPFHHTFWHLFVLVGSFTHFLSILIYLT